MHFVEQNYKLLIKTKRNRKWKIPRKVLERRFLLSQAQTHHSFTFNPFMTEAVII